ncbi:multidrug resistance protein mdtA [Raoultella ornithinolytica]|nr:multidrug resistance protein mdtA [Raoultella ornithinolytica]
MSPPPPWNRRRRGVTTQQITLDYTRIDSPVSGRIGHSRFHVGSLVGPTSGMLVDIVQLDPIRVSFALDEAAFYSKAGSMPISAR